MHGSMKHFFCNKLSVIGGDFFLNSIFEGFQLKMYIFFGLATAKQLKNLSFHVRIDPRTESWRGLHRTSNPLSFRPISTRQTAQYLPVVRLVSAASNSRQSERVGAGDWCGGVRRRLF